MSFVLDDTAKTNWKFIGIVAILAILVSGLFVYYEYQQFQTQQRYYNNHRFDYIILLGQWIEEYKRIYESYTCSLNAASCDWQKELSRINQNVTIPYDPETQKPYIYLTDGMDSLVGAKLYTSSFHATAICNKSGDGLPTWYIYQTAHKDIKVHCIDKLNNGHIR